MLPELAPEAKATDALVPQLVPQQLLGISLVLPQETDAVIGHRRVASKTPSPYPLPRGEGGLNWLPCD